MSDKKAVSAFLDELNEVLGSQEFNIAEDLLIIKSSKDEIQFSTNFTMVDLEYDPEDIVERLKELTIFDYSETLFDDSNDNPPLLFVFGKDINNMLVYIKLKIKGDTSKESSLFIFSLCKIYYDVPI